MLKKIKTFLGFNGIKLMNVRTAKYNFESQIMDVTFKDGRIVNYVGEGMCWRELTNIEPLPYSTHIVLNTLQKYIERENKPFNIYV